MKTQVGETIASNFAPQLSQLASRASRFSSSQQLAAFWLGSLKLSKPSALKERAEINSWLNRFLIKTDRTSNESVRFIFKSVNIQAILIFSKSKLHGNLSE